ncbi:MAG: hypothetical protein BWK72_07385 [Rhodoferax ferrireducens]|uniref:Uncharacterized protein n=2 Tax=Pseudomonadota TaxID=1224 RepID=A0A1Y1QZL2_9GAMM|nr:MAG: hypothetical protein BWK72_07385 [Rhodoferax ferrireducens]OQX17322.1 MAG: hypothetical protein BWK73_01155 [Thiothrix lacustris]
MDDLKKKTLQGLLYLGVGKGAGKFISFGTTLALARMLSPQDYGLMALVMVVVGFLEFFNEIGLGSAIKQRPQITPSQLNGCFTLSLLISTGLYAALFLASPAIASYYDNDALSPVLRFIGLTFVIGAAVTVPDALMARNMQFKLFAGIDFVMVVLQSAVTLTLALLGLGVWALAWGFLVAQIFKSLCIFFFSRWRPSKLGEVSEALSLMRFGVTVTYSRLTWYLYNNAQTLIIGKTLGAQAVGIYSMAGTLSSLPSSHITSMVIRVASPLFAKLQHDRQRLNNTLLRLTSGIALINYPVIVGMAITASELVPVVLGPQWLEATLPLQILSLIGLIKSVDPLLTQALTSTGQVNVTARYTTLCAITIPLSVYIGSVQGGLAGAALAMAVAYPLSSIYLFMAVRRYLDLSLMHYLQAVRLPLEACAWMAGIVLGGGQLLTMLGLQNAAILLGVKTTLGVLTYAGFLIYVRPAGLRDCHEVLCELGVPADKLRRWPFSRLTVQTNDN